MGVTGSATATCVKTDRVDHAEFRACDLGARWRFSSKHTLAASNRCPGDTGRDLGSLMGALYSVSTAF